MKKRVVNLFLRWIPLILINIYVVFPILWAGITSIKPEADILKKNIQYIPRNPTLENYRQAWINADFSQYYVNSLKISTISVIIIVILSIMAGYALSRYKFKGKMLFMGLLLAIQFIPGAVLLVPVFTMFNQVHLVGTHLSLIIINVTFQLPFNAILMRGFIGGIPFALEEAALIDGCSKRQAFFKILTPMLIPGMITVGAFAFIGCWNEFLFSFMLLNDKTKYTIPIGLIMMQGEYSVNYGALAAGAISAMTIPVVLFAYLQKYLVTGLSMGAVKE